jgi:hypothetical protein
MFYSEFILAKKGPLAKVWLAAHWERKLSKAQISQTNVVRSVEDIVNPVAPLALRLSSQLLLGVVKIYSRQAKYLLDDCSEILTRIKSMFKWNTPVTTNGPAYLSADLPSHPTMAQWNAITLPEQAELDWNLYLSLTEPTMLLSFDEESTTASSLARSESMNVLPPLEKARRQSILLGSDVPNFDMFNDEGFGVADADELNVYRELEKSLGPMKTSLQPPSGIASVDRATFSSLKDDGVEGDHRNSIERPRDLQQELSTLLEFPGLEVSPSPRRSSTTNRLTRSRGGINDANERDIVGSPIDDTADLSMRVGLGDVSRMSMEPFDVQWTSFRQEDTGKDTHGIQANRRIRKRSRLIDEQTELAVGTIQKQLKDTSDLVLTVSQTLRAPEFPYPVHLSRR